MTERGGVIPTCSDEGCNLTAGCRGNGKEALLTDSRVHELTTSEVSWVAPTAVDAVFDCRDAVLCKVIKKNSSRRLVHSEKHRCNGQSLGTCVAETWLGSTMIRKPNNQARFMKLLLASSFYVRRRTSWSSLALFWVRKDCTA